MSAFEFHADRYPPHPGCYIMRDQSGKVIYVGKSRNLRHRLASYFRKIPSSRKVAQIQAIIADIEVILVNTETESLLLENNLIKFYKPRFNSMYKPENTGYYYIIQTGEDYPRLLPFRKNRISKQMERLRDIPITCRFGPYVNKEYRDILLEYTCNAYRIRTCDPIPNKACLHAQLKTCSAPCEGKISTETYQSNLEQAVEFLSGPQPDLVEKMHQKMAHFASDLLFEHAQRVKRQIQALEATLAPQCVEQDLSYDQDVVYFGATKVLIAHIFQGMVLSLDLQPLPLSETNPHIYFLMDYYAQSHPDELIISTALDSTNPDPLLGGFNKLAYPIKIAKEQPSDGLLNLCALNYHFRVPDEFPG